jgi:hypothetical protein
MQKLDSASAQQLERGMTHEGERFANIVITSIKRSKRASFSPALVGYRERSYIRLDAVIIRSMSDCLFFRFFFSHPPESIALIIMMRPSGSMGMQQQPAELTRSCMKKKKKKEERTEQYRAISSSRSSKHNL